MKKNVGIFSALSLSLFLIGLYPSSSFAAGSGGMRECIDLSMKAALDAYAEKNSFLPVPAIQMQWNANGEGGGLNFIANIGGNTYKMITTAIEGPNHQSILGCTSSYVDKN